jgi:hypothetical protein
VDIAATRFVRCRETARLQNSGFALESTLTKGKVTPYPPSHVEALETSNQRLAFEIDVVQHW